MRPSSASILAGLALAIACVSAPAREPVNTLVVPASGVPGVTDAQLDPAFWVARMGADADRVLLDANAITAANARMQSTDPSLYDLSALPASVTKAQANEWITDLSSRPSKPLFDEQHQAIPAATIDGLVDALALDKTADTPLTTLIRAASCIRRSRERHLSMAPSPTDRYRRVDAVFDALLDLPPDEQMAYLDRTAGDDPELHAEVLRLLHAHRRSEGFLDSPAADWRAAARRPELASVRERRPSASVPGASCARSAGAAWASSSSASAPTASSSSGPRSS